jgi:hypothetical protein
MRVTNETKWSTADLKKLAMEVAYRETALTTEGRKNLKIEFWHGSTGAWRRSPNRPGRIRIKLPRPLVADEPLGFEARVALTQTLSWGIGAAIGMRQREMAGLTKYTFGLSAESFTFWEWVRDFPITQKPVKKVDPFFFPEQSVKSAQMSVERWERKLKLAMTKLGMWKRELKKRENKLRCLEKPVEPNSLVSSRKFRKPPEVPAWEKTCREGRII